MGLFKKSARIEDVVGAFAKGFPSYVRGVRQVDKGDSHTHEIADSEIVSVCSGTVLFLLAEALPYQKPENVDLMARAFQSMWVHTEKVVGNSDMARNWFDILNAGLLSDEELDRVEYTNKMIRKHLYPNLADDDYCPLTIVTRPIQQSIADIKKLKIV